ncbi:MAG: hypothetical protein M3126_11335 [Candidatus Eremiobacteraeota bacterium]|nr:hypothetical protein [Candidatus Eremiobacteraeota bacterium]
MLKPAFAGDEEFVRRLYAEARSAARTGYAARMTDAPANTIIEQVKPGTRVREYSRAVLVVSAGPQPDVFYPGPADGGGGGGGD